MIILIFLINTWWRIPWSFPGSLQNKTTRQRNTLCQVVMPLGRLAKETRIEGILPSLAELIHSHTQVPTLEHTGSSQGYVHVQQHTGQGWVTQSNSNAVDQGSTEKAIYNLSKPNPSSSPTAVSPKGKNSKNTRTGRTLSQQKPSRTVPQRTACCWARNHGVDQAPASQEEQGKQRNNPEAKPLHQHLFLGAGVRYKQKSMSKHQFCS